MSTKYGPTLLLNLKYWPLSPSFMGRWLAHLQSTHYVNFAWADLLNKVP